MNECVKECQGNLGKRARTQTNERLARGSHREAEGVQNLAGGHVQDVPRRAWQGVAIVLYDCRPGSASPSNQAPPAVSRQRPLQPGQGPGSGCWVENRDCSGIVAARSVRPSLILESWTFGNPAPSLVGALGDKDRRLRRLQFQVGEPNQAHRVCIERRGAVRIQSSVRLLRTRVNMLFGSTALCSGQPQICTPSHIHPLPI